MRARDPRRIRTEMEYIKGFRPTCAEVNGHGHKFNSKKLFGFVPRPSHVFQQEVHIR